MIIKSIEGVKYLIGRCINCNTHFKILYNQNSINYECPVCKKQYIILRSR